MFKISAHLIEAYLGYFEVDFDKEYDVYVAGEIEKGFVIVESKEPYIERLATQMIIEDTPKRRLEIYLEWNGILGYTDVIHDIATGKIS